jgi:ABC-2 type transport system permease protein
MHFLKTANFYFHLLRTSIKASISLRWSFLLQMFLMIMNNLIFFSVWYLFFIQFNDIGGWQFRDMAVLMTIGTGAYGLRQILFGGVKSLARSIVNGGLDPFMTQPKNLLIHMIGSRSMPKGWGHLLTSFILILLAGLTDFYTLSMILISIVSGCLIFVSMSIIAHSLSFWLGPIEGLANRYCDSLYLFALYPSNIYSDILRFMMFTVLPAGLISYLPVELVREFSWDKLAGVVGGALFLAALSFFVFYQGLRRYESGNQVNVRN